mgnify:FL=1
MIKLVCDVCGVVYMCDFASFVRGHECCRQPMSIVKAEWEKEIVESLGDIGTTIIATLREKVSENEKV